MNIWLSLVKGSLLKTKANDMKNSFLIFLLSLYIYSLSAQYKSIGHSAFFNAQDCVSFNSDDEFIQHYSNRLGISNQDKYKLMDARSANDGVTYNRYKHFHKGLEVIGASLICHHKHGQLISANGLFKQNIDLDINPDISQAEAFQIAKNIFKNETSNTALPSVQLNKLCIINQDYPRASQDYKLAYELLVHSSDPAYKKLYYIDAHSKNLILAAPLHYHDAIEGSGNTLFYGEKGFVVNQKSQNKFCLHDITRGNGNAVYDRDTLNGPISQTSNTWNYYSDKEKAALDVHWGTLQFYNYLFYNLGWDGLDGQGASMNSIINTFDGDEYVNAFWDGELAHFGAGSCHYHPLVSLDVVGHEFAHGITQKTANLIYLAESGAINEAMSDILGKALESYADGQNFSWDIGRKFILHPEAEPFRSMEDPNLYDCPKYYRGNLWSDDGDVHTNSGVLNHWFYLLAEGGQGVTENVEEYNVVALGMNKATQLAFTMLTQYMTENTGYREAYELSILAANQLFGSNSNELVSINEAWKAVGLLNENQTKFHDLRLSGLVYGDVTCYKNEWYPVDLYIENNGDSTLAANVEIPITLFGWGWAVDEQIVHTLSEDFAPGETVHIHLDSLIYIENTDFYYMLARIELDDNIYRNNRTDLGLDNLIRDSFDLEIVDYFADRDICFDTETSLHLTFRNNSCVPIPSGTEYTITVQRGGEIFHTQTEYLMEDLLPAENKSISIQVSSHFEYTWHLLNIECAIDAYPDNNQESINIDQGASITVGYKNPMDVESDKEYNIQFDDRNAGNFINYEGKSMLALSQYNYSYPQVPCLDPFRSFENYFNPRLSFCADFEGVSEPTMEIDLVQFRANEDPQDWYENQYQSMVWLHWKSDLGFGNEYFIDQIEGDIVRNKVSFPANFKGQVEMTFFTFYGNGGSTYAYDFELFDILLLDSLIVYDAAPVMVHTEEETISVEIFPNPTQDFLYINTTQQLSKFEIINASGKLVKANHIKKAIQINELDAGVYFIRLYNKNGLKYTPQKFIKM